MAISHIRCFLSFGCLALIACTQNADIAKTSATGSAAARKSHFSVNSFKNEAQKASPTRDAPLTQFGDKNLPRFHGAGLENDSTAKSEAVELGKGAIPTGDDLQSDPEISAMAATAATQSETGVGSATLSWLPPIEDVNGSSSTRLASYRIDYGQQPEALDRNIHIDNPSLSTYVIDNLASGVWFFRLVAIGVDGVEGKPTEIISKIVD